MFLGECGWRGVGKEERFLEVQAGVRRERSSRKNKREWEKGDGEGLEGAGQAIAGVGGNLSTTAIIAVWPLQQPVQQPLQSP